MIARVLVALVAVACLAWLGTGLVVERLQIRGVARAEPVSASPADLREARRLLDRAARLTPDTFPDIAVGNLLFRERRYEAAVAALAPLTRREPDNADAWLALMLAAKGVDEPLFAESQRQLRRLVRTPAR